MKMSFSHVSNSFIIALLMVVGVALYAPSFSNEMFWDDNDFILNNQYIKDWQFFPKMFTGNVIEGAGLVSNYYRPVLLMVFSLEWHAFGENVPGWHIMNAVIHSLDAGLLFLLLVKLFKKRWLALFAASLFLVHPVQTEAVAYVNSLGDSLSFFWMLLALLVFQKAATQANVFRNGWYYISLIMYPLALLSKETAIILPGFIFLIAFFSDNRESFKLRFSRSLLSIVPFLLIGVVYLFLRAGPLNFQNTFNLYNEQNIFTESILLRILTFFRILVVYIGLIFWPASLHMERTVAIVNGFSFDVLAGGLILISMLVAAWRYHRRMPEIAFGLLWFLVALAPTSNIVVPINGFLYEHWLYVPLAGAGVAVFASGKKLFDFLSRKSAADFQPVLIFVLLFIFIALSVRTIVRIRDWSTPIRLYSQTLEYAPESYRVLNNLGMSYADRRDIHSAIIYYQKAIGVDETNPVALHNLGNAYQDLGDNETAVSFYKQALKRDPTFTYSLNNLVNLYIRHGDIKQARLVLEQSARSSKQPIQILALLVQLAVNEKDYLGAQIYITQALELDPGNGELLRAKLEIEKLIST